MDKIIQEVNDVQFCNKTYYMHNSELLKADFRNLNHDLKSRGFITKINYCPTRFLELDFNEDEHFAYEVFLKKRPFPYTAYAVYILFLLGVLYLCFKI
jgi:hypothetical protein